MTRVSFLEPPGPLTAIRGGPPRSGVLIVPFILCEGLAILQVLRWVSLAGASFLPFFFAPARMIPFVSFFPPSYPPPPRKSLSEKHRLTGRGPFHSRHHVQIFFPCLDRPHARLTLFRLKFVLLTDSHRLRVILSPLKGSVSVFPSSHSFALVFRGDGPLREARDSSTGILFSFILVPILSTSFFRCSQHSFRFDLRQRSLFDARRCELPPGRQYMLSPEASSFLSPSFVWTCCITPALSLSAMPQSFRFLMKTLRYCRRSGPPFVS